MTASPLRLTWASPSLGDDLPPRSVLTVGHAAPLAGGEEAPAHSDEGLINGTALGRGAHRPSFESRAAPA